MRQAIHRLFNAAAGAAVKTKDNVTFLGKPPTKAGGGDRVVVLGTGWGSFTLAKSLKHAD